VQILCKSLCDHSILGVEPACNASSVASCAHLSTKQLGKLGGRKEAGQDAASSGDLLDLVLPHGLLEDACQAIPFALLGLEVTVWPVMQQASKPAPSRNIKSRFAKTVQGDFVRHGSVTGCNKAHLDMH